MDKMMEFNSTHEALAYISEKINELEEANKKLNKIEPAFRWALLIGILVMVAGVSYFIYNNNSTIGIHIALIAFLYNFVMYAINKNIIKNLTINTSLIYQLCQQKLKLIGYDLNAMNN